MRGFEQTQLLRIHLTGWQELLPSPAQNTIDAITVVKVHQLRGNVPTAPGSRLIRKVGHRIPSRVPQHVHIVQPASRE